MPIEGEDRRIHGVAYVSATDIAKQGRGPEAEAAAKTVETVRFPPEALASCMRGVYDRAGVRLLATRCAALCERCSASQHVVTPRVCSYVLLGRL